MSLIAQSTLAIVAALMLFGSFDKALADGAPLHEESLEALSEAVHDPTARLSQLQFKEIYTPAEYGTDAQLNTLLIRPVLVVRPHGRLNFDQVVRLSFSLVTEPLGRGAATRTGIGDSRLLDLLVIPWPDPRRSRLRWGIGPYFIFPTASFHEAGKGAWQAGPAAAFGYRGIPRLLIAGLLRQATSFAYTSPQRVPVTSLTFQPRLSYRLGEGWYIKSSDATWTFNLRHNTSTTIPLSIGVGKVWRLGDGTAVNGAIAGEWMVYRQFEPQTEQFTLKFTLNLLLSRLTM